MKWIVGRRRPSDIPAIIRRYLRVVNIFYLFSIEPPRSDPLLYRQLSQVCCYGEGELTIISLQSN